MTSQQFANLMLADFQSDRKGWNASAQIDGWYFGFNSSRGLPKASHNSGERDPSVMPDYRPRETNDNASPEYNAILETVAEIVGKQK